jgi:hypothetical protein
MEKCLFKKIIAHIFSKFKTVLKKSACKPWKSKWNGTPEPITEWSERAYGKCQAREIRQEHPDEL